MSPDPGQNAGFCSDQADSDKTFMSQNRFQIDPYRLENMEYTAVLYGNEDIQPREISGSVRGQLLYEPVENEATLNITERVAIVLGSDHAIHLLVASSQSDILSSIELQDQVIGLIQKPHGWKELQKYAMEREYSVKLVLVSLDLNFQDEPDILDDYALLRVFSAGMPPVITYAEEGFRLPARCGLPLGVAPIEQPLQSIEWNAGEKLHIHTELPDFMLRDFHEHLSGMNPESVELPPALHISLEGKVL